MRAFSQASSSIQIPMCRVRLFLMPLLLAGITFAHGFEGVFQGQIVTPRKAKQGWLYVLSKNGFLRKVEVKRAQVEYDDDFPARDRLARPQDSLRPATVIRVTANQGRDGEWHASHILIVAMGI